MTTHRPMRAERNAHGWTIRCSCGRYITPTQASAALAGLVFEDNHGEFAGYVHATTITTGAQR